MRNRCVITDEGKNTAVYLHWEGDRTFVEAACKYCELKQYREPHFDHGYAMARLTQVIANYLGGDTGIGIYSYTNDEDMYGLAWDHGVFVVGKGWQVIENIGGAYDEDNIPGFSWETVMAIDAAQPQREQLGIDKIAWYRDGCPEQDDSLTLEKAMKAVKMFVEQTYGMHIIDEFDSFIVARDDGEIVFIDVQCDYGSLPNENIDREKFEGAALEYLRGRGGEPSLIRFDIASISMLGEAKGLLRYHTNAVNHG